MLKPRKNPRDEKKVESFLGSRAYRFYRTIVYAGHDAVVFIVGIFARTVSIKNTKHSASKWKG